MKVIHIESGLGNQMLSYAELLLLRKINKVDEFYIETIVYEIPECNEHICQWNGYELERVFNIKEKNIREIFDETQWKNIILDVSASRFWETWNYPNVIVNALNNQGTKLKNYRGDVLPLPENKLKKILTDNGAVCWLKRVLRPFYQKRYIKRMSLRNQMHLITEENIFTGQWLGLMRRESGIEVVKEEIKNAFKFPDLEDNKNIELLNILKSTNSVAIHARRGDALGTNGYCYKYGYFKRSVKYIRRKIDNPIFVFFTDPGSIDWCKDNANIFGLDFSKDKVFFVDWNSGENSYKDMQLMSYCKHNIITFSSFGWWGAWLNENPNKITISPSVWINTTHHF